MKLISFCDRNAYKEFAHMKNEETDNVIRRATNSGKPFGSKSGESFIETQEPWVHKILNREVSLVFLVFVFYKLTCQR